MKNLPETTKLKIMFALTRLAQLFCIGGVIMFTSTLATNIIEPTYSLSFEQKRAAWLFSIIFAILALIMQYFVKLIRTEIPKNA